MSGLNIKSVTYVVGTYYVQTKLQRDFRKSLVNGDVYGDKSHV